MEYFTPSIEDIRVGYEAEMSLNGKDNWRHVILKEKDFEPFSWFDHHEEKPTYRKVTFRTPYLTTEQILAEGWKEGTKGVTTITKEPIQYFLKDNHVIMWVECHRHIEISIKVNEDIFRYLYQGECKDINTFRYICKLLGI